MRSRSPSQEVGETGLRPTGKSRTLLVRLGIVPAGLQEINEKLNLTCLIPETLASGVMGSTGTTVARKAKTKDREGTGNPPSNPPASAGYRISSAPASATCPRAPRQGGMCLPERRSLEVGTRIQKEPPFILIDCLPPSGEMSPVCWCPLSLSFPSK